MKICLTFAAPSVNRWQLRIDGDRFSRSPSDIALLNRSSSSVVRTFRRVPADPLPPPATQLDLFPFPPVIEPLDPKSAIGSHTGVERLVRVRLRPAETPHLVFHDRHGWYCEVHGPHCEAVRLAKRANGTVD